MALLINPLGEQETLQQFDGKRFFSETNIQIINCYCREVRPKKKKKSS